MVTTEGAGSTKLDLTQIQDGIAGAEHALPAAPLYRDVVELMARSGVAYNTTLMVASEASAQDYFIVAKHPNADAKLNRFSPRFIVDMKTRKRTWRELADYPFPAYAQSAARLVRSGGLVGHGQPWRSAGPGIPLGNGRPRDGRHDDCRDAVRRDDGVRRGHRSRERIRIHRAGARWRIWWCSTAIPCADIRNTLAIDAVMKDGRLYDASTLDEVWPWPRKFPELWYRNDKPPGGAESR